MRVDGLGRGASGADTRTSVQTSLEVLEYEICVLAARLASETCRWLLLVAEFDAREGWAAWGMNSCAEWLSWRCGIGIGAARDHVRVARMLGCLPLVQAAFAAGELSYSKVRALTRVASEKTEAELVELAKHATGAQLEKLCGKYGQALRASCEQAKAINERQALHLHWDDDGMLVVQGRLAPEDGAALMRALERAAESVPADTQELGAAAVRAQALVGLATGGGQDVELVVHVDAQTLTAEEIVQQAEIEGGPVLAPETVRRLGCDAAVVAIIEQDGKPLSVGRRTRAIPPALRRALRSRDQGCRFPGCTHTRYLHAHHIEHWARGGATEIDNLLALCSHHHRLVHEGGYAVTGRAGDEPEFRGPDGRLIASVCAAPKLTEMQAVLGAEAIGPESCRPLSAGDGLDYEMAVGWLMWREDQPL